jgi:DNA-binding transcriptional MocR family regulator
MSEDSSIATLVERIKGRAAQLRPGDALPSTRVLVDEYRVSPVTVSRALAVLVAEGLVVTRPGAGTYVTGRPGLTPANEADLAWQAVPLSDRMVDTSRLAGLVQPPAEGVISLASGYPGSDLVPTRALAAAVGRVARRSDVWDRPPAAGIAGLRRWFARTVGGAIEPDHVVITTGGQSALSTAFRAILPPGAPILVESPTYLGALAVAKSAGLRPVPVPVDAGGIQPSHLALAFAATSARALYLQPTFQNPTGMTLAENRRDQVLKICADAGAFVIEDDYARWLSHEKPSPPALAARDTAGRVVLIASLTKSTAAGFRIGALIGRGPVLERLRSLRLVDDFFVARLIQEAALELVTGPAWTRHLKAVSAALALRRDTLARALARHLPELHMVGLPAGGMHIWVRLPDGLDDLQVAERAQAAGVLVGPGRPFYAAEPPAGHLRLTYAGTPQLSDLDEGVRRLARSLRM